MDKTSYRCECACDFVFARAPMRARLAALGCVMRFIAMLGAFAGCRTANYTAAKLPPHLEVPPASPAMSINLANVADRGLGTSQIAPGDLVEATIASGRETERINPVMARVAQDGTVLVPLVGPVPIQGLDPIEAEQRIAAAAVERGVFRQPYVTLRVAEQAVNRVTVLGAVAKPGVVELPRGSSDLISALAAAGGLAKDAGTKVDVLHHEPTTLMATQSGESAARGPSDVRLASYAGSAPSTTAIDFSPPPLPNVSHPGSGANFTNQALSTPRATRIDLAKIHPTAGVNHELADRDVVMVLPDEKQVIHVTGLVLRPNQFEISPRRDIRLLDAIALAGGAKSPLADKVFVIRQLPNMREPTVIRASLFDAKRDGRENLRLAPGDLVSVEATPATLVLDTATNFFRVAVGVSGNIMTF